MRGREVPRLIVQWPLEGDPVVILDVLDLHGECELADWVDEHRDDLRRRFDQVLAEMRGRCEHAAERDLGKRAA